MTMESARLSESLRNHFVTLTRAADQGDVEGRDRLFSDWYDKLHRLAQRELRNHAAITLSPTTLLHETFLNLAQRESAASFDRSRFLAYAARAMRGLVIDYLRARQAQKRGGEFEFTSLPTDVLLDDDQQVRVKALNDALLALEKIDQRLSECVDMRF